MNAVSLAAPPAVAPSEIAALAALIPDSAFKADPPPTPVQPSTAIPGAERSTPPVPDKVHTDEPAPEAAKEEPVAEAPAAPPADADALTRAEAAAKIARQGSKRYREAVEERDRRAAEARRMAAEAEQLRQEVAEARRLRETFKKDPYKVMKDLGMTDKDLAERALRDGTPDQAIYELKAVLEQERQARIALEQHLQAERVAAAQRQAEQTFTTLADNEAKYPQLSQLSPRAQLAAARAAIQQITDNGYDPNLLSDEQVVEAAEQFLAPKRGKAAKTEAKPAPKPAAKPVTLTNAATNTKASASRPWHELSEDEQIAQIAASLPDPT